jgi:hypothetical protein
MEFYTTPRLEAMMQDYTRLLESSENVGCTVRTNVCGIQLIINNTRVCSLPPINMLFQ